MLPQRQPSFVNATALSQSEVLTLDALMAALRDSPDLKAYDRRQHEGSRQVIAVAGNWYDCVHKAPKLGRLHKQRPEADLLLTGGREERLTPLEAAELGGEPILLQRTLSTQQHVDPRRMILWTGSRVTNHNIQAMLQYAKQVHEFTRQTVALTVVEEGFLVRREAASLGTHLRRDPVAQAALAAVRIEPVGAVSFEELVAVHRGRVDLGLALLLGEHDRLKRYVKPGNQTTATHGYVSHGAMLSGGQLDGALASAVDALQARHADGLLKRGLDILERAPREQMLRIATPLTSNSAAERAFEANKAGTRRQARRRRRRLWSRH